MAVVASLKIPNIILSLVFISATNLLMSATTIFIKSPLGNSYEVKIDKDEATIADLRSEISNNESYAEIKKLTFHVLTGLEPDKILEQVNEEIKDNIVKLLPIYYEGKPQLDTTELENNGTYFLGGVNDFTLSSKFATSFTAFMKLLCLYDENSDKQLQEFSMLLAKNGQYFSDFFSVTRYLGKTLLLEELVSQLPYILENNAKLLNSREFFITDALVKKEVKEILLKKFDNTLQFLRLKGIKNSATLDKNNGGHSSYVHSVAWDKTGNYLASASWDKTIKIWDVTTKTQPKLLLTLDKHNGGHSYFVESVAWDPTNNYLASGSHDNTIKIWDVTTKTQPKLLSTIDKYFGGHIKPVESIAWDKTGNYLASASQDNTIKIWDVSTKTQPKLLATLDKNNGGHNTWVYSVALDKTGNFLASANIHGAIKIWDASTKTQPKLLVTLDENNGGHTHTVRSVAWDKTGNFLASASYDKKIKIWDVTIKTQPKLLVTLDKNNGGHTHTVRSVAWDKTGNFLASASYDKKIKIWDILNKTQPKLLLTLDKHNGGHSYFVDSVAWDPTNNYLASGSDDETIKIWSPSFDPKTLTLEKLILKIMFAKSPDLNVKKDGWIFMTQEIERQLDDLKEFKKLTKKDENTLQKLLQEEFIKNPKKILEKTLRQRLQEAQETTKKLLPTAKELKNDMKILDK